MGFVVNYPPATNVTVNDDGTQVVVAAAGPRGPQGPAGPSPIINTDGDPGTAIYIGSVDPDGSYTLQAGDVWIEPA